jgi:predicted transcriptional regulator
MRLFTHSKTKNNTDEARLLQYKQDAAAEGSHMATASVRLDKDLIDKATIIAKAFNRTPPKQIEHWAIIGELMEDNPDLPYEFVRQSIIAEAEREAGKLEGYDFG